MSFLKPRNMSTNRDKLLTAAEFAILEKGVAATSIDELIAEVGITKSGFFYHFQNKSALVHALLQRHLKEEEAWFEQLFLRASRTSDDPLESFLTFLRFLTEDMQNLPNVHPGCLISACCYQERLFEGDVHDIAAENLLCWRRRFRGELAAIEAVHPLQIPVDLDALADTLTALIDGAIILSKVVREKDVLPNQVTIYSQFIRAAFNGI